MIIQNNHSLKEYNTFGIQASAKNFIEIKDLKTLNEFLQGEIHSFEPLLVLGGGSNILFTEDFNGTVLKISTKGIRIAEENNDEVFVEAEAGEIWDDVVNFCVEKGIFGIENLAKIPGTIGAAPVQNIGAYGVELKDVFHSLEGLFIRSGEKKIFTLADCGFGYRDSVFKHMYRGEIIITSVVLKLKKNAQINLKYRAFEDYIRTTKKEIETLADVRDAVAEIRSSKLPEPAVFGNAGSFFKNPEIDSEHLISLKEKYKDLVYFEIGDNRYKIPAGWLIEKAGFKGKKVGNTGTFDKQALIIVNYGGANGKDILRFANSIKKIIRDKFRIDLHPEVNIL